MESMATEDTKEMYGEEEEEEELVKDTKEYLPYWITHEQVMNVLQNSQNNMVEAVSFFYEHETEFYDEVFTSNLDEEAPPPTVTEPVHDCKIPESVDPSNHDRLSIALLRLKNTISRWKNRKNKKNSGGKKTGKSPLGFGSKQREITKFFQKKTGMNTV